LRRAGPIRDVAVGVVNPSIYGHFAEHLNRGTSRVLDIFLQERCFAPVK